MGGMLCTKFADMFKENEKMLDKITKLALGETEDAFRPGPF